MRIAVLGVGRMGQLHARIAAAHPARPVVPALVAGLLAAGCAIGQPAPSPAIAEPPASDGAGNRIRIGASFPVLDPALDPFFALVANEMTARAAELDGVDLVLHAAEDDAETQVRHVEQLVAEGVDALVVVPVDTRATAPITTLAKDSGTPLVYVSRRPDDLPVDGSVPYVGSDALDAGTVEMIALASLLEDRGNVAILMGDPATEAAVRRTEGCKDVVAARPAMRLVREQAADWSRERAREVTRAWLAAEDEPPIDAVCANNDEMALGAIEAFREAGLLDRVIVGGVDATPDAIAAMRAGDLEVTVFQDGPAQGTLGIDTAVRLVRGARVVTEEGVIDVPFRLVTQDNVDEVAPTRAP